MFGPCGPLKTSRSVNKKLLKHARKQFDVFSPFRFYSENLTELMQ